jgi:hypothetical protein
MQIPFYTGQVQGSAGSVPTSGKKPASDRLVQVRFNHACRVDRTTHRTDAMRQNASTAAGTLKFTSGIDQQLIALMHRKKDERFKMSASLPLDISDIVSAG